jgi:hypothetical protein
MGNLGIYFCQVANEVRELLNKGCRDEAHDLVIAKLRSGYSSKEFLSLVAELLILARARKVWPKPKGIPPGWLEIGEAFEELLEEGSTYGEAVKELANRFSLGDGTIRRAVRVYREAYQQATSP